jgi:hypothetical protein
MVPEPNFPAVSESMEPASEIGQGASLFEAVPQIVEHQCILEFEPEAGASGTGLHHGKATDAPLLQETGGVNGDPREYRQRNAKFVTNLWSHSPLTNRMVNTAIRMVFALGVAKESSLRASNPSRFTRMNRHSNAGEQENRDCELELRHRHTKRCSPIS